MCLKPFLLEIGAIINLSTGEWMVTKIQDENLTLMNNKTLAEETHTFQDLQEKSKLFLYTLPKLSVEFNDIPKETFQLNLTEFHASNHKMKILFDEIDKNI